MKKRAVQKIDRKASKKRRKRAIKTYFQRVGKLLVLGLLIGLIVAIIKIPYFLTSTSSLALKETIIEVKGGLLTSKDVDRLFKRFIQKKYSSLEPNILKLNLQEVEEYLASQPVIKTVKVKRHLPQRIVIKAEGRLPLIELPSGGRWLGIDREASPFPLKAKLKLPVVSGLKRIVLGKKIDHPAIEDIFLFKQKDEQLGTGLWPRIRQINISNNLCLEIDSGTRVYLGQSLEEKSLEARLKELNIILKHFEAKGEVKEYIDLRFDNIILKDS